MNDLTILNIEDVLSILHQYELWRSDERIFITIREIITPHKEIKFIAVPNLIIKESTEKYFGCGSTK